MTETLTAKERFPLSYWLALAANFFFFAGFQWTYATLPAFVQELGGDAAALGLSYGLFSLSALLARPIVGWLVDRWGRKPVMFLGALIFVVSPALYALLPSLWPFQMVRLFHGVGIAAFTTAYATLVADLAPLSRRGEGIGLSGVTYNLPLLFAPAAGVFVVQNWGYAVHFWLAAVFSVVGVILILPIAEPKREPPVGDENPSLLSVARIRPVWVVSFAVTGLAVVYGAVLSFLPALADFKGLTTAGAYFTAFALALIVSQTVAGWLSDRIGRLAVTIPGLVLAIPASLALGLVRTDLGLMAAGATFGVAWGLGRVGLDTILIDGVSPRARGTAISFLYICFDMGVGVGSFGLGIIAQSRGLPAAFYAAAIWAVIALVGFLVWGRGLGQRESQNPGG
jgi:MFS family permease